MAGTKYDEEKVRIDLVPPEFIEAVATILTFGAAKYEAHNWRGGIDYSRVYAALQRHLLAWWKRENVDKESGKSHLWHAACCLAFLTTYELYPEQYAQHDDRYEAGFSQATSSDSNIPPGDSHHLTNPPSL